MRDAALVEDARRFYGRWILAKGGSEAAGLGTTFVLGRQLAPVLDGSPGLARVITGAVAAILLGVVLEGVSRDSPRARSCAVA